MELRERKIISNTRNLPEYAEGKLLHKPTLQGLDSMITGGVNFLGLAVNSFGGVKSSGDIIAESGTSVGQGSGFTYQKLNSVDAGALMSEVSSLNTANTLNTAAAGASLGSAFGPIGAGIGGVVGGAVGFVGGLFRKNKMAERIKLAQLLTIRNNNFSLASAQTDFLTKDYNVNHDNTQDDLLYQAKDGKLPGFADGFDGRAKISNGEIYGHVDRFGNVLDMRRAGHGKDNNDTLTRRLGNTQDEFNRAFVVTNKGGASDYVAATGDVAGGLEIGNIMKDFRAVKLLSTGAFNYKNGLIPKFEDGIPPITNVDTRSDSTRRGIHEGRIPYGAGEYLTSPLDALNMVLNYNITGNPNIITGLAPIAGGNVNATIDKIEKAARLAKISKADRAASAAISREMDILDDELFFKNLANPRSSWNSAGSLDQPMGAKRLRMFKPIHDYKGGKLPKYANQKVAFPIAPTIPVPNQTSDNHISPYKQLFSGLGDTEKRNVLGYAVEPQLSQLTKDVLKSNYDKANEDISRQLTASKYDNSNLYNVITSSAGILGGLSQILGAHKQPLNERDTYAPNLYERQALDIYSWLNPATNKAVLAAAATEARNKYNINRMGGLSGAQKYLASVQSGIGLQKNIADIIAETQMQRNQLKSQLAGAMLNTGAANAQRRQNANQYLDEAYARSHGARTQMEQMGMQNMIAALNQYYKNFDKLNRFNRTMAYYDQDYQLRKDALNQGFYR